MSFISHGKNGIKSEEEKSSDLQGGKGIVIYQLITKVTYTIARVRGAIF